jgi:hypothetical protein
VSTKRSAAAGIRLVDQRVYGQINLTDVGHKTAKEILQRHVMLRRFLTEVLELDERPLTRMPAAWNMPSASRPVITGLPWLERFLESRRIRMTAACKAERK